MFFVLVQLSAQADNRDSLMSLLQNSVDDTNKVNTLLRVAGFYETSNQDSSVYYLELAHNLAEKLNYKKGLITYHLQKGIVLFTMGNYAASMEQQKQALQIAEAMKDSIRIINVLVNTGIVYQYLGNFDQQLEVTLRALSLIERFKSYKKLSSTYHNIGNAYFNLKQYNKSLEYCKLAIEANHKYGGNSYPNRVLATIGQSYEQLGQTDSALVYYKLAVKESKALNDKYSEAGIYGFMSNLYAGFQQFSTMLEVSKKSMELSKELQSRQLEATSLYNLAFAYYFNGRLAEADETIRKARNIAEKDTLIDELKNIYLIQSYIAASQNDFKTLLKTKSKHDSIQQVLVNKEVIGAAIEYQEKYESDKKLIQINLQQAQLKHKKFINFILLGSIFWISLVSFLVYRNLQHRHKLQQNRIHELETEKQLMAAEAVLKGEEQERTRIAKDLHDGLGGMLSGIKYSFTTMKGNLIMTPENQQAFERSLNMLDSSIKEMRRVAHNMMPEALLRFGLDMALQDFCNEIKQNGAIKIDYHSTGIENVILEETLSITIYRIIQELLHNVLKHSGANAAIVQVIKSGNKLVVTVEDDGKGFNASLLENNKGIGWINIKNRVEFLKGTLDITTGPNEGTSVQIEIDI